MSITLDVSLGDIVDFYDQFPELVGSINVETQYGYKKIEYAACTAENSDVIRVVFRNGAAIEGSPDHLLQNQNGQWVPLKNIVVGDFFNSKEGPVEVVYVDELGLRRDLFDLQVAEVNEFYANGIVSHNSSILQAVSLGLFGKVSGINKNTLVNDVNGRDCLVEVECEKNGQEIFVRRGIKPNVFDIYIDGKLIDQSASSRDYQKWLEETVFGFNLSSFQQVVSISGANYSPFFMMPAGQRRKMVEDLLSITVFSKMYALHIGQMNALKDAVVNCEKDIEKYQETIQALKLGLEELSNRDEDLRLITEQQIAIYREKILVVESEKEMLHREIADNEYSTIELSKLNTKLSKMNTISNELRTSRRSASKFIEFMEQNETCPTCFNGLTEEFKASHICARQTKINEIDGKTVELSKMIEDVSSKIADINARQDKINKAKNNIKRLDSEISTLTQLIKSQEDSLRKSYDSKNESSIRDEIVRMDALLQSARDNRLRLLVDKQYLDLQTAILKDSGIKSRIINQIVPKMTKDINHFLTVMELGARFEVDENFNETIYRRFKDPAQYANLSAGEKARVDIAVLFTWREIAKEKNSLSCNLLFLDEIFDNTLDEAGLDLFINLLKGLNGTNVFLISHRPEVVDKFESVMKIEKRGNFSSIN